MGLVDAAARAEPARDAAPVGRGRRGAPARVGGARTRGSRRSSSRGRRSRTTTIVLVASDGEWTRRRIGGPAAARKLARSMRMPVYDVQIVGYPQRMRDHDARQRILRDRQRRRDLGA